MSRKAGSRFNAAAKYPGAAEQPTHTGDHGCPCRHSAPTPVSVEEVRAEVAKRRLLSDAQVAELTDAIRQADAPARMVGDAYGWKATKRKGMAGVSLTVARPESGQKAGVSTPERVPATRTGKHGDSSLPPAA